MPLVSNKVFEEFTNLEKEFQEFEKDILTNGSESMSKTSSNFLEEIVKGSPYSTDQICYYVKALDNARRSRLAFSYQILNQIHIKDLEKSIQGNSELIKNLQERIHFIQLKE